MKLRAVTMAGLSFKARLVKRYNEDVGELADQLLNSLVADLAAGAA